MNNSVIIEFCNYSLLIIIMPKTHESPYSLYREFLP